MRNCLAIITCLLAITPAPCREPAPALSPKQIMAADAAAKASLERDKLVGLAYGLIHGGRVAHTAGLGLADREAGVPVSTQTRF
ncbi:MAG: beta-lactamase family protein, partial [Gemmataceae bacterium]|nr:beta-lactamase family protein [Gemmataceae bacterium]